MGLLILSAVLTVVGFIWYSRDDEPLPCLIAVAGAVCLAVCIILLPIVYGAHSDNLVAYSQDKAQIELTYNNSNLTGEERTAAITLATNDNQIILQQRRWSKNFFVGIFNSKRIAALPLFDLKKISQANSSVTVSKK